MPFQVSASVCWAPVTPTATQRLTAEHEMPDKSLNAGLGAEMGRSTQPEPFRDSASAATRPEAYTALPAAWQRVVVAQETPPR